MDRHLRQQKFAGSYYITKQKIPRSYTTYASLHTLARTVGNVECIKNVLCGVGHCEVLAAYHLSTITCASPKTSKSVLQMSDSDYLTLVRAIAIRITTPIVAFVSFSTFTIVDTFNSWLGQWCFKLSALRLTPTRPPFLRLCPLLYKLSLSLLKPLDSFRFSSLIR